MHIFHLSTLLDQQCWSNNVGPTTLFVCRWTKQPLTLLAQCCFVEAGNIGWLGGCGSGSCTHLCMFNNGGTCFDSDLVPHLNKYWEIISYASENSSGPIFSLHSNCHNYQRGSYFFKQYLTVLDFPLMHYFTCSLMKFVDFLVCLEKFFHVCPLALLSCQELTLHWSVLISIILPFSFETTFSQHVWVTDSNSCLNSRWQMLNPV